MTKPSVQCPHYAPGAMQAWALGRCWIVDEQGIRWDIDFNACIPCVGRQGAFIEAVQREHQRRPFWWMGLPQ